MARHHRAVLLSLFTATIVLAPRAHAATPELTRARQLEEKGDVAAARALLVSAAQAPGASAELLADYAAFLDRRRDPGARAAYQKAIAALPGSAGAQRSALTRRVAILDSLSPHDPQRSASRSMPEASFVEIPGPLRSFSRMAALAPDMPAEDLLPALARNVVTNGYQAINSNEGLEQTEYLKLVVRYLSQARELEKLSGADKVIRIENCDSSQTADLLKVLGFRMRGGCGSEVVLETVNAARAFLTIDSGFPIAGLEESLRTSRPFVLDYKPTKIPVLYTPDYWLGAKEKNVPDVGFIDFFLSDPSVCRLYLGLSKLDAGTSAELKKGVPIQRLRAFSHVLDFFGGMFEIRDGKAVTPGGAKSVALWTEFVGASPDSGAAFLEKLIAKDDGWLAALYDSCARLSGPSQEYLLKPERMRRIYLAVRGKITSPGPARPVFRANTDMMLLTSRLRIEADGRPHIPGGLEVWKNLFIHHPHGKYDGKLTKSAVGWKEPDDLIEALFALCRKAVENEPLKIYLTLTDINRRRAKPLEPATVDRMMREYRLYGAQYPLINEVPSLSDRTILQLLDNAVALNGVRDLPARADAVGMMQSLVGLWQIFCRNRLIPDSEADGTLAEILSPFAKVKNPRELFDAGRNGVQLLFKATATASGVNPQDRIMDLVAGQSKVVDDDSHTLVVQDMIRIFDAQRLISLKTLFDLADNLEAQSKGGKLDLQLVTRLSSRIQEIQPPRIALSGAEKNAMAFGYYTEKHIESQRKANFRAIVEKAAGDPEKLRDARGLLAQFLRDTLVGFNYIHYAPPGAQILFTNPLFVRSHDFIGVQGANQTWKTTEVFGTGWPSSAGGRLVGSLANLPYALAEAEQNFMIPSREQALIWGDLVPQMILMAKIPRWWDVTPVQMHWTALHLRFTESLVAEAAADPPRRAELLASLARQASPSRVRRVEAHLEAGDARAASDNITPSEAFLVAAEMMKAHGDDASVEGSEIRRLAQAYSREANYPAISRAFGTPKPTLAASYSPELLNLRTFPTLMGYSSRILAESWESSLLYYAALADELQMQPSQLNVAVPLWTQKTVERIFATHLEDWPALLRSLRLVGDDIRAAARKPAAEQKAALQ